MFSLENLYEKKWYINQIKAIIYGHFKRIFIKLINLIH